MLSSKIKVSKLRILVLLFFKFCRPRIGSQCDKKKNPSVKFMSKVIHFVILKIPLNVTNTVEFGSGFNKILILRK